MKIFSWNVNGIRAVANKGEWQKFLNEQNPDVICLQETKATIEQVCEIVDKKYQVFASEADKKGYSGTAILVGDEIKAQQLESPKFDLVDNFGNLGGEGRITTVEFADFILVSVYTPNSKNGLERLAIREKWDKEFLKYVDELREIKPVIFAGDLNVAHSEIDLARPKDNIGKHGFTDEERRGFDNILSTGFVDSFRKLHPNEKNKYTWWTHWANARANNVGWRIDYFMLDEKIVKNLENAEIYQSQIGSDHCPVAISIEI